MDFERCGHFLSREGLMNMNHITVDADGFCLDSEVNIYIAIWVLVKC